MSAQRQIGFLRGAEDQTKTLIELLPSGPASPDAVATLLAVLPPYCVLIFDEFDRLRPSQTASFADFVKSLSDRGSQSTVVLVGVAEDINSLILSHASVERCLRQIRLQRMSEQELAQIIDEGLAAANFSLESDSPKNRILAVSQGFPHYTHLLGLYAARTALDDTRTVINNMDVIRGTSTAVDRAEQSHLDLYYKATTGTKKTNLWKQVVAACALAEADERGYFSGRAVQESLSGILNRPIIQQTVAFHLGKLTEESRGAST
jgi:Cdc6-like AAA superfamily ATPase